MLEPGGNVSTKKEIFYRVTPMSFSFASLPCFLHSTWSTLLPCKHQTVYLNKPDSIAYYTFSLFAIDMAYLLSDMVYLTIRNITILSFSKTLYQMQGTQVYN